ncbi:hypothetical protein AUG19_06920 [archaeon 13_1_20CM_2_54_9]|nr:MAG: hypothetical protein AUJ07_07925 [Crenarchaeota archaeon 13_1_40CM_3_53_5]OLE74973.1 MAG: hypothetical protein AUG19_06920 [archaeon 13_1_20CM_2_54_9]TMI28286.1 MAG: NAD(P)/FAD-dependent oxidoreductase [Candidatus Bathyarchaeota archaeon]TMI31258.1 MAG: NAD(P)/FAD-dependent oxidoreductase [Candidatus Bathyarchaeota archaeon]
MSLKNQVVVLGCGVGGLTFASTLAKQAKGSASVTVIERKSRFQFPPSYTWVVMGWREPKQVQRDLTPLARKKVKIINEAVIKIDLSAKRVATSSSQIAYDYLVVALGAEHVPGEIPGFEDYAHQFYDLVSALKFREALNGFAGNTVSVGVSRTPFKCPAAPYEMSLLLDDNFRKQGKKVEVHMFTPEAQALPATGPVIGKQVERMLATRGIKYHPKKKLVKVARDSIVFEDGEEINHDLLVAVPPHRCPSVVVDAGLTDSSGWVPVNPNTLATKVEDVYAIGDVSAIETPHGHMPFLPKAGVFAQGQAEILANNIAHSITGKGERKAWDGSGTCFLEVSKSESAFLRGTFLSKPPRLEFHPPRRKWHFDKIALEKFWMTYRL